MVEDQEYLSLSDVAKAVGLNRSSLYYYIKELRINTRKFPHNRHRYMLKADAERIQIVKNKPWKQE